MEDEPFNLIGWDTIVNSPSFLYILYDDMPMTILGKVFIADVKSQTGYSRRTAIFN